MRIFRKKIDPADLAELSARDIARCCGVSERTARGWKRYGPPPAAARLLALAVGDMEAVFGRNWRGWWMENAALESPDGQHWTPARLGAWWIERQQIPSLQALLARYESGVPVIDRREYDRLQDAAQAIAACQHALASLYPSTHERAGDAREAPPAASVAVSG